jgi:hypothetical protein
MYVPGNPTTSKVSVSLQKFPSSPKVTGSSIYLSWATFIPGTTPWHEVDDGWS